MVWIVKGSQSLLAEFYMGSFKKIFTRERRTEWNRKKREKKDRGGREFSQNSDSKLFCAYFFYNSMFDPLHLKSL